MFVVWLRKMERSLGDVTLRSCDHAAAEVLVAADFLGTRRWNEVIVETGNRRVLRSIAGVCDLWLRKRREALGVWCNGRDIRCANCMGVAE